MFLVHSSSRRIPCDQLQNRITIFGRTYSITGELRHWFANRMSLYIYCYTEYLNHLLESAWAVYATSWTALYHWSGRASLQEDQKIRKRSSWLLPLVKMADYVYMRHVPEKVTMLSITTLCLSDYCFNFSLSPQRYNLTSVSLSSLQCIWRS